MRFAPNDFDGAQTALRRGLRGESPQARTRTQDAEESYAGFWVIRPDQAARFSVPFTATPLVNLTPSMTIGNCFAPFRRRHVFAAA